MSAEQPRRSREIKPDHVILAFRVIAHLVFPWLTAKFLYKPRVGPRRRDRALDRLAFWRSVVGLLAVLVATNGYLSPFVVLSDNYGKALRTAGYALLAAPLPFLVLLAVTRSGFRSELFSGGRRMLGRGALGLAALGLPLAVFFAADGGRYFVDSLTELLLVLIAVVVIGWYATFWVCTLYWAARTSFWMSEIHPLLAPVASVFFVLLITVQEIIQLDTKGVPIPLWLALNLCGLASTLALAVFEYRHAWSTGFRFRGGPRPVPAPGRLDRTKLAGQ
ncbi:hypothetical protein AB0I53_11175 [Saccharopolyspora sp. NPDC050389]|uniref:hypothetical protein n=1 Tax=Saccharopolyspora sp. NPDC050389 TaxID=3155516 RepID=UPI0033D92919